MAMTVAEWNAAIASVHADGQEYTIADREVKQARLTELLEGKRLAVAEERAEQHMMFQRVRMGRLK